MWLWERGRRKLNLQDSSCFAPFEEARLHYWAVSEHLAKLSPVWSTRMHLGISHLHRRGQDSLRGLSSVDGGWSRWLSRKIQHVSHRTPQLYIEGSFSQKAGLAWVCFLRDAYLSTENGDEFYTRKIEWNVLTSSCTRSWMSSNTRTDGASKTCNSCWFRQQNSSFTILYVI